VTVAIEVHATVPSRDRLLSAAEAYIATFSRPPYDEPPSARDAFLERVERYSQRDGFALALAIDGGQVSGLALAVTAHPGDWWRDQVAANLSPVEIDRWLGEATLELVHLAVVPVAQGHGVGGRLHDEILAGSSCSSGILTVDPRAMPARRLYDSRGWIVVRESALVGTSSGAILMGRRLNA
jgi:GNAT superfamily N-acetyltransferase